MNDEEKKEESTSNEDTSKESNEPKKDNVESKPVETDAKPENTEFGKLDDLMKAIKSVKQEVIDYVDLKFSSMPIAKVEKSEETTKDEKKELPVW